MNHPPAKPPFQLSAWIEQNRHLLQPPVSNKLLFDDKSGMIVQIIGGGNKRVDFHDDPVQEFFYQIKGDMILKIHDGTGLRDIHIAEGDVFLLPPHVPHSPQRPDPSSVGLVLEGARLPGMTDGFEWYCFNCGAKVARVEVTLSDIVKDLPPLFDAFYANEARRTCPNCGVMHPGKEPPAGWATL
ncbi:MAG: 3-hydroxyanthranilate 3,4-dioxygenase [Sphingobium sp.]